MRQFYTFIIYITIQNKQHLLTKMQNQAITQEQLYKQIPQLTISPQGIFKYILIRCYMNKMPFATFIRGDKKFSYHAENYDEFCRQVKRSGFKQVKKKEQKITATRDGNKYQFICPGGGRIEHNYQGNKCSIYGYSQSYGHVDHSQTKRIIMQRLKYKNQEIKLNQKDY